MALCIINDGNIQVDGASGSIDFSRTNSVIGTHSKTEEVCEYVNNERSTACMLALDGHFMEKSNNYACVLPSAAFLFTRISSRKFSLRVSYGRAKRAKYFALL